MNRAQPIAQSMHDFMDNEDGLLGEILITKEVRGIQAFPADLFSSSLGFRYFWSTFSPSKR
jgi:hypothetical protein